MQLNRDYEFTGQWQPGKELTTPAIKPSAAIAFSASVFEGDRDHSWAAGDDEFLPKPVPPGELLEKLHKYLTIH
ncbi:MAG: hypothetical protein Fur0025_11010 [Oscillatoriaceae cyanobacterium]